MLQTGQSTYHAYLLLIQHHVAAVSVHQLPSTAFVHGHVLLTMTTALLSVIKIASSLEHVAHHPFDLTQLINASVPGSCTVV